MQSEEALGAVGLEHLHAGTVQDLDGGQLTDQGG